MTIDCLFSVKNDRIMDWHKVLFPFKENVSIKIHRRYLIIIIKQIKYDLACSSVIRNSSKLWKWSKRRNSSFKLTCAVDIFVFHCREELNKKSLPVNCLYIIDSHEFQTHLFQSKTIKKFQISLSKIRDVNILNTSEQRYNVTGQLKRLSLF